MRVRLRRGGMTEKKRRRQGSFLDDYQIDDQMVLKPDRKAGKPGVYAGFDPDGDPVLVKFWPKVAGAPDEDLREIWHNEVRQLHRLGGYPGAERSIATLHQTGVDATGFYLVLKPGQRRPLAKFLEHLPPGHWLANPRNPANRAKLWRNLLRIVGGLEILHTQGLLHRSLDHWSILATGGDEPDFLLTGFEWSLRLVGVAAPVGRARATPLGLAQPASFLEDWKALGRLAAHLLGLPEQRLLNLSIPASDVSETVSVDETRLLRNLIHAEPLDRVDGDIVAARIGAILDSLGADIAGRDPKLHLVVQLGVGSRLAEQIAEASGQTAEVGEAQAQRAFIADDLRQSCLLVAIRNPDDEGFRLALRGGHH
jgi:hypothetical protein